MRSRSKYKSSKAHGRSKKIRRRWVVKAGSNLVCAGGPLLIRSWMQQVAELKKHHGIEIVWVTSGAIASAVDRTGVKKKERSLAEKQALSAIGQPLIMDLYNLALQTQGLLGAQLLLTYDDLADSTRQNNFKNSLEQLLKWGVVPILNENDAVATEEIKFGDNDSLSAKVAICTGAEKLIILTDVEGFYKTEKSHLTSLISNLPQVTSKVLSQVSHHGGSDRGTGGMRSKLKAAQEANHQGIETWLAKGDLPSVLIQVAKNQKIGTRIGASIASSSEK